MPQTPEQLAATIKATGMTPAPAAPGQTPAPIAVSTMTTPQAPVPVAAPAVVPTPNIGNITIAPSIAPTTPTQATSSLSALDKLTAEWGNRTTETQRITNEQTAPAQQTLNQLNTQLKIQQANALKNQEAAMKQGDTLGFATREAQNIARTDAIETLRIAALTEAAQGNLALAEKHATDAVNTKYAQIESDIKTAKANVYAIYDSLSPEEKRIADAKLLALDKDDTFVAQAKQDAKDINALALTAAQNGADALTLRSIQNATTADEALNIMAAKGFVNDPLQREQDRLNLESTRTDIAYKKAQMGKIQAEIDAGKPIDPNKLVPAGATPEVKNNAVLSTLLTNPKIGQGTRTTIGNVLGVLKAVEDMANTNQSGTFEGVNPINALLNVKIPFTDIGFPGRQALKKEGSIQNEGYINAINLQTQVWASGAALTTEQTEQVKKFTPTVTDTDANVRTKLNNLANYMLTQTSARLQSEGITYAPEKVNLFQLRDDIEKLSPEQKKQLKDAGLLPSWAK